jgi:hypothetical protein
MLKNYPFIQNIRFMTKHISDFTCLMSIHFVMCNGITHFKDTYFKDNMVEGETSKGESNWTRRNARALS